MTNLVFAYAWVLPWVGGVTALAGMYVLWFKRKIRYRYALAHVIKQQGSAVTLPIRHILFALRLGALITLALLIGRPQWLDTQRDLCIKGVDIVLTIDVSGSMELFDDLKDRTQRIEAAKREALSFIAKRTNDPIGIVLFASQALSKVPLTLDKTLLLNTVKELELGDIDANDTLLFTGLATSINRLRTSTAKSKIIVMLTDGVPSENDPIDADTVIGLAREFGIKIYTLGVGRANMAYTYDQFGRVAQIPSNVDAAMLKKIATETGGYYYRVHTPAELKSAYETIDKLEQTDIKTTLFQQYHEAFTWFAWFALLCVIAELLLRMFLWKGLV
ncbi:MAG: Ca-activated chloride channel [Candidatus Dependentiae bacterium]|nr:Ca-activated chloride channel [Candidatus Dependentiae bacterium]